ncbi:MAG: M28 family peptidase [Spirochaetes bacterium]|nr:M28 family peptidase [Spirochaetota bacterium]
MNPREFEAFLGCADRLSFLEAWLAARGVATKRTRMGAAIHLVARFGKEAYGKDAGGRDSPVRLFAAHYDRAPGTPGALDNSGACAALAALAVELAGDSGRRFGRHDVVIIFTDAEELSEGGLVDQGAYGIARAFTGSGAVPTVIVLDVAGRGDTILVSDSAVALARERAMRAGTPEAAAVADRAASLAANACGILACAGFRVLSVPLPYSDDLGFSVAGIPAVVLSVLPSTEADAYAAAMRGAPIPRGDWASILKSAGTSFPPTWKLLHTAFDDASVLEESTAVLVGRVLELLVRSRP